MDMEFARLPVNKIMFWGACNGAKFISWLELSELNLTNIPESWVLVGMECASSARCAAQEMEGLYFSITECSCSLGFLE